MTQTNTMYEFIVWANCTNKCDFCPQSLKNINILTEEEKLNSIYKLNVSLDKIPENSDVLIIGGELFNTHSNEVNKAIIGLFSHIRKLMSENKIRYLYTNSNLIYKDISLLRQVLDIFLELTDTQELLIKRVKFATSLDTGYRFKNNQVEGETAKSIFKQNLYEICHVYPDLKVIVNTIMTKSFYDIYVHPEYFTQEVLEDKNFDEDKYSFIDYSLKNLKDKYGVYDVNFLPYIIHPLITNRELDITLPQICEILMKREKEEPGFIQKHISEFDNSQKRICYQYSRTEGEYIESTAQNNDCGHNKNFSLNLEHKCYICSIRDIFGL